MEHKWQHNCTKPDKYRAANWNIKDVSQCI